MNLITTTNTYHEVSLDEIELLRQALLRSVVSSSIDLIVVVVQTGDVAAGELCDFARRSANTTSDVKHLHTLLDSDLVGKVVLMTGNRLIKGLAVGEAAEVEGLAPAILVQIGRQVVVATRLELASVCTGGGGECAAYCLVKVAYSAVRAYVKRRSASVTSKDRFKAEKVRVAYCALLGSFVLCSLVVPVLEVLIDGSLLRITAFAEHGGKTTGGLSTRTVQCLVELSIASVVLALEVRGC